jgi:hypothetical protein
MHPARSSVLVADAPGYRRSSTVSGCLAAFAPAHGRPGAITILKAHVVSLYVEGELYVLSLAYVVGISAYKFGTVGIGAILKNRDVECVSQQTPLDSLGVPATLVVDAKLVRAEAHHFVEVNLAYNSRAAFDAGVGLVHEAIENHHDLGAIVKILGCIDFGIVEIHIGEPRGRMRRILRIVSRCGTDSRPRLEKRSKPRRIINIGCRVVMRDPHKIVKGRKAPRKISDGSAFSII